MSLTSVPINSAEDMETFGAICSRGTHIISSIYLSGDLGTGKTTFVRGLLRAMDYTGAVKSPTYTLVESYALGGTTIHHFDLYRMNQAEELEAIGVRDYFSEDAICLVEWPEKAEDYLPEPDLMLRIEYDGGGRKIHIKALSDEGKQFLDEIKSDLPT